MKKLGALLLAITAYSCIALTANAQSYKTGINVINAGVGFGYSVGYVSGVNATPILSASFEHGSRQLGPGTLGFGGILSYQGASFSESNAFGSYKQSWSATYLGFRATWHPEILVSGTYDVYGALQLGYVTYGYDFSGTGVYADDAYKVKNNLNSGLGLGLIVGGRYYFTDNIGAFLELGYDLSYSKIGVAFNF